MDPFTIVIAVTTLTVCGLLIIGLLTRISNLEKEIKKIDPHPVIQIDTKQLHNAIEALPNKVLHCVQGSINTHKGTLGELIGYVQLRAQYDRIIPLNDIADFLCISLGTNEIPGHIDFVDVKTGSSARLSKDQRTLRKLVLEKRVNFITTQVTTTCEPK